MPFVLHEAENRTAEAESRVGRQQILEGLLVPSDSVGMS